jgi:hypothetical protein
LLADTIHPLEDAAERVQQNEKTAGCSSHPTADERPKPAGFGDFLNVEF